MIEHVFVLMLENRSFDHMLGWSGITGIDAATGEPAEVHGLREGMSNTLPGGRVIPVVRGAQFQLDADPRHEFASVLEHLCGAGAVLAGGKYPPITNGGFASRFATDWPKQATKAEFPVMAGFTPDQLPVLNALAREFAVCDRWFSSLPGPTWPNRFFVHAASSAGLDASPSGVRTVTALVDGYRFANGTVYDALEKAGKSWLVVEGDAFPQSMALHGMLEKTLHGQFVPMDQFKKALAAPGFDTSYVFIEPAYGHVLSDGSNFRGGNSQHPQDDVTAGEALIKEVYETIRGSAYWETSLLIITWDEHGGFYDHVAPPAAVPPGDTWPDPTTNVNGFRFDQLGVRVPAVVVSPLIPRGTIDHAVHDHSSVSSTLREVFGTAALTERDRQAAGVAGLASLASPRSDAPATLPAPADSGIKPGEVPWTERVAGDLEVIQEALSGRPEEALIGFVEVAAMRSVHLAARETGSVAAAVEKVGAELEERLRGLETKWHVARFLRDVERKYLG